MEKALRIFYRIKCKNSNTLDQYQRYIGEFLTYLKNNYKVKEPEDIKQYMVIEYISSLDEKVQDKRYKEEKLIELSNNTKYTKLKVVSSLLTFLFENEFMSKNLSKAIDLKKYKEKEHKDIYLKQEECSLLFDYLQSGYVFKGKRNETFNRARDTLLYSIMLKHGNRVTELLTLREKDVDLLNNKIMIEGKNRKNGEDLTNKVDKQMFEYYNKYKAVKDTMNFNTDLVFTSANGSKLFRSNINNNLRKRIEEANKWAKITGDNRRIDTEKVMLMSAHKMRHSCASLLNSQNNSLQTIASILGQKTVKITRDVYTHTDNMDVDLIQL